MLADGMVFTATQLPFNKPILLVYFVPGCEHCETITRNLLKEKSLLAKFSVAMITYKSVGEVAAFISQFGLKKNRNFFVGTEGNSFFVKEYFNLQQLPFMALYTKNGNLVKKYTSEKEWDDLLKQIKKFK